MSANGSYTYIVASSNKVYAPVQRYGTLSINDSSASLSITFSKVTYTVIFSETGLSSGTYWYVNFSGTNKSSLDGTITFSSANGTYTYFTGSSNGYITSNSSGSIAVNGSKVTKAITFNSAGGTASSGITSTEMYIIIGAVVAIAAVGSAFALTRKGNKK